MRKFIIIILLFQCGILFADNPSLTLTSKNVKEGVSVIAVLKDAKGTPIPDAAINFSTLTTFGSLKLKSIPTGEDGSASLLITGSDRKGDFIVEANFKGDEKHAPVSEKTNITFSEYKQKETSTLRLFFPILISFSQILDYLIPKSSDIFVSTEEGGRFSFTEIPLGTSITPYPSLELVSILFIIFAVIWSIYLYIVTQILQLKK